jgi:hypothetical protein
MPLDRHPQAGLGRFLIGLLLLIAGCGAPTGQVTGTVTHQGQGIAGAELRFVSATSEEDTFSGISRLNGKYQLSYPTLDGMPVGRYMVTISIHTLPSGVPFPPGERAESMKQEGKLVRADYTFEQEVAAGPNTIDFELTQGQKVSAAQ